MRSLLLAVMLVPTSWLAADGRDRFRPERWEDRSPVWDALRDLEAIASRSNVDRHEANHFRHAIGDLQEFREDARRGRFDRGRLSSAIAHIGHLAAARQLHPRDRRTLREDLRALSALRSGSSYAGRRR